MSDDYLLGDSDPELERLRQQHVVWRDATVAGWRHADLAPGERVLDVGCGPGFTTLELAEAVGPGGSVVGIDPSDRFTRYLESAALAAGHEHVQIRHAAIDDLGKATGGPNDRPADGLAGIGTFDLIHIRWVLCFLTEPGKAIGKLAALLRPGGRLVTLDYFNYRAFALAPRVPAMKAVVQAVFDSWAQSGGSLEVQGATPRHCAAAGLTVTDVAQVSGIARPGDPRFDWPEDFLRGYVPRLVAQGFLDEATAASFLADWSMRKHEAGTFLYLPPLVRVIARKPIGTA